MKGALQALRKEMAREKTDVYLIPMDDFHQSEYVSEYFKTIRHITGFTGDSCNVVVTQDEAKFFTDGRFFIQAERELYDGVDLMKMGEKGVPTLTQYIETVLPEGGVLGFDGRCVNSGLGKQLEALAEKKKGKIQADKDLVGNVWPERPSLPKEKVWILEEKWAGESAEKKLSRLREEMTEKGADIHVIASLDDIAWLLNLRGWDVLCTPVFLSFLLIDRENCYLFANEENFDESVKRYLEKLQVRLAPYNGIYDAVKQLRNRTILLQGGKTNYAILRSIDPSVSVVDALLPSTYDKAIKNEVEIQNERTAHIKDGIALTKYIYFMKHAFRDGKLTEEAKERLQAPELTECSGAAYLQRLRKEDPHYLEDSFPAISAYGENAALPHYSPSEEHDKKVEASGFYLIDSGGQYYEGTTDVTRTIAMGPLKKEEIRHFTMVCMAMLRLADAKLLQGSSGVTFDYAGREIFWREGLNYNHGTGHGVGYCLSCHEGPIGIRYRYLPSRLENVEFNPGNIVSDEPGFYVEGQYGIRTENLMVCKKAIENEFGMFMDFEHLTMAPIDLDALDKSIMLPHDIELLNAYHKDVYEKLSPYFEGEILAWLKEATRAI